ncbi:MAG: 30S ribosomal protein S6 [Verrucomicrobiia bacterium]
MNKYEGLFILDSAAQEQAVKDIVGKIRKEIEQAGGRVEKVNTLGQHPFARPTAKQSAGQYVNVLFEAPPKAISELDAKLHLDTDVFRWMFTAVVLEKKLDPKKKKKAGQTEKAVARE